MVKILTFILVGELVFRFEKSIVNHEIYDHDTIQIPFYEQNSELNILLLGDSFTSGLGISSADRISNQIRARGIGVLDSSKSGNNWLDYFEQITHYQGYDTTDFIVIGVNWDDVGFSIGAIRELVRGESFNADFYFSENNKNSEFKGIRKIYYSRLFSTLSAYVQSQMKRNGFPLPLGDFHYRRTTAYMDHAKDFEIIWSTLEDLVDTTNTEVLLYLMPEFNLTNRAYYFDNFVKEMSMRPPEIHVLNGIEDFSSSRDGEFCISIYDGHPNAAASKKIAKDIVEYIQHNRSNTKRIKYRAIN